MMRARKLRALSATPSSTPKVTSSREATAANVEDRDGAADLSERALRKYPRKRIFADGGYAGPKLASALSGLPVKLEIVKRTDENGGFKVLHRRWVIERTFSWLRRNRRLMLTTKHSR
jgi:transposase